MDGSRKIKFDNLPGGCIGEVACSIRSVARNGGFGSCDIYLVINIPTVLIVG